jgi:hypothetical protein
MEKKIVSPFEYVIMQAAKIEDIDNYRPETQEEKKKRLSNYAVEFAKQIRVKY